jgi:hypothetical protein
VTAILLALLAAPNTWERLDGAAIDGRRWDVPLAYDPGSKRFLILGGRTTWADYKKPRPYDVLSLDRKEGAWENDFPEGKDWGPKVGPCRAPAWKDEYWHFRDTEGNTRPNWTVYGTFSLGQKYDYDLDARAFYFHANGKTFRYDPARRAWADLAPASTPEKELGGILLWSSMCYDSHNKRFLLFGGGNVQTPRGDPGTWSYTPATNAWKRLSPRAQPPQRANSRLAYDLVHKKAVLFGGDQLDCLLADTWTFDVTKDEWEQARPKRSPSPRGGHAFLWLPRARRLLLVGGYAYTSATGYCESLYAPLPAEVWTYDTATETWEMLTRPATGKDGPRGPANAFWSAAVDDDDTVCLLAQDGAWLAAIDASKPSEALTAKWGVKPGAEVRRTGSHDPAWYLDVPNPDPAKVEAGLKALPANQWTLRPTPRLPKTNMDWGSAVYIESTAQIVRYSGGHSAYSGTAPQVYDTRTDRYTLPFAPEYPLEYVYSNDQVHGEWSFKGRPWMTGHTYKATGYDPFSKSLAFVPRGYTYFFDSRRGEWSRSEERSPHRPNMYHDTLCPTPKGLVLWAEKKTGGPGLWRLEGGKWKPLPLKGPLPQQSPDRHGLAYDSKRSRLLFFSDMGKEKGDVAAYDFDSGEVKWLSPAGRGKAAVPSRETAYLPDLDAVLIGARVKADGKMAWLLYDCGKNRWEAAIFAGEDPIARGAFNNSMGLMYDPARKLVWAVGQYSQVYVLRPEGGTLKRAPLE